MEEQVRLTGKFAPHRQRGGAMVEFAFVFPILFMLIYGVIVYSYLFVLQSSMNFAAQEAVEAAVAVDPDPSVNPTFPAPVVPVAQAAAAAALSWLPSDQQARVIGTNGSQVAVTFPTTNSVQVTLTFNVTQSPPLFPQLTLPIVGTVPPLPAQMVAQATGRD